MGRVRFNNYSDDISSVNSLILSSAPSDIISEPMSSLYCPSPVEQFPQFTLLNRSSLDSHVSDKTMESAQESGSSTSELDVIDEELMSPENSLSPIDLLPSESIMASNLPVNGLEESVTAILPHNIITPIVPSSKPRANTSSTPTPQNIPIVDRDARQISAMIPTAENTAFNLSLARSASQPALQHESSTAGQFSHTRSNSDSDSSSKKSATKPNASDSTFSQPYFTGYLYKLGRNGTWNWRFFRFDGLYLTCMHKSNGEQMQPKWTINITDVEQIALLRKPHTAFSNSSSDGASKLRTLFRKATTGVAIPEIGKNDELTVLASTSMSPGTDGLSAAGIDMSRFGILPQDNAQSSTAWNLLSPQSVFGAGGRYANMCFVIRTKLGHNFILRAKENEDLERWVWLLVRMWQIRRNPSSPSQNTSASYPISLNRNPQTISSSNTMSRLGSYDNLVPDPVERKFSPPIVRSKSVNSSETSSKSVSYKVTTPDGQLISVPPRKYSLSRNQPATFGPEPLPRIDTVSTESDVELEEDEKDGRRRSDSIASFLSDDALTDIVSNPSVPRTSIRMSVSLTSHIKQKPLPSIPRETSLMMDTLIGVNSPQSALHRNPSLLAKKIPPRKGSILANEANKSNLSNAFSKRESTTSISWTSQYLPRPPTSTPPPPPNYTPHPPRFTRPEHHLQIHPSESLERLLTKDVKSEKTLNEAMSPNFEVMNEFRKSLGELLSVDPDVYVDMSRSKSTFASSTISPTPMLSILSQNPLNEQFKPNPNVQNYATLAVNRQIGMVNSPSSPSSQTPKSGLNFPTPPREILRSK
ncbi:hypothetical protein HK098_000203 [Nowakowskiella sp. JEL0407]|nr:hypothetical protein HK098_000203 [Nowakowskiella sp. JEL0407]